MKLSSKKLIALIGCLIFVGTLLAGCSARSQARWSGTVNLGDIPDDVLYVDNVPQIITVSTESDGDIVLSYYSNDGKIVAQLYGCPIVSLSCEKLEKQGRYEWDIPENTQSELTPKKLFELLIQR